MPLDPFDGNYSAQALQSQIDALRSTQVNTASFDNASRMQQMQAMAAYESQMRMQRVQQEMLASMQRANLSVLANQTPVGQALTSMMGPNPTGFVGGRNIAYTSAGAATQGFFGLVGDAGLSRSAYTMTGGLAFRDYQMAFGASRNQVGQIAGDELRLRMMGFLRGTAASLTPDFLLNRFGSRFDTQTGDFTRSIASVYANRRVLNGVDRRFMTADGIGLRASLDEDISIPEAIAYNQALAVERLNAGRGFSLTEEESKTIKQLGTDYLAINAQAAERALFDRGTSSTSKLIDAINSLEKSINANVDGIDELIRQGLNLGVEPDTVAAMGREVGKMVTNSQLSNFEEMKQRLALVQEGRAMGYGYGDQYAGMSRDLAESLRNNLTRMGTVGRRELYMYGGANDTDAAIRYQQARQRMNETIMSNVGSSVGYGGLLGLTGAGLSDFTGGLGAAYNADPLGFIKSMMDPQRRLLMTTSADISSFAFSRELAARSGMRSEEDANAIGVMLMAQQTGQPITEAAREYALKMQDVNRLTPAATKMGVSPEQLMAFQRAMEQQGIPSNFIDFDKIADDEAKKAEAVNLITTGKFDTVSLLNLSDNYVSAKYGQMMRERHRYLMTPDQIAEMNIPELEQYFTEAIKSGAMTEAQARKIVESTDANRATSAVGLTSAGEFGLVKQFDGGYRITRPSGVEDSEGFFDLMFWNDFRRSLSGNAPTVETNPNLLSLLNTSIEETYRSEDAVTKAIKEIAAGDSAAESDIYEKVNSILSKDPSVEPLDFDPSVPPGFSEELRVASGRELQTLAVLFDQLRKQKADNAINPTNTILSSIGIDAFKKLRNALNDREYDE